MKRGFFNFFGKSDNPISAEKVMFSYDSTQILKDISLNIKEGKITAIIGKSGSGKTTFLKIVSGIIPFGYSGRIEVFGKAKFLQKYNIGFVPQEKSFIPDLSILENIKIMGLNLGIPESLAIKRAQELLQLLHLDIDLNRSPEFMSGGQKTRLNIILSILHDPKILVLDEPFVGLDFRNRRLLWHFLEKMRSKGKSIVLTSHLLTEIQDHVDRIVLLKQGKVFFHGNLENLKEKLKVKFIYEVSFSHISKDKLEKIRKYCLYKDVEILDFYDRHIMFSIGSIRTRNALVSLFEKLKIDFKETAFREPNLDEIFLKF